MKSSIEPWRGKTVVVTGAASGIGRAVVLEALRRRAAVAALDRDEAGLQQLSAPPGTHLSRHVCDVTRAESCRQAVDAARALTGGIDVLVSCAGITHRSLFAETDPQVIRRVVEVNLLGTVYCTHAVLPDLLERRGVVAAISSVAGFAPLIGRTGYAASKHGLHGFLDSLRSEVASRGVGVVIVCPSYTATSLDRHALAGDGTRLERGKNTVGRLATPEDVAAATLRGIERRRRLVLPSAVGRSAYLLSRLAPRLYERVMLRTHRSEFEPPERR